MNPDTDTVNYPPEELCSRIATLTDSIMSFWDDGGWAQGEAACLLDRSMLLWQASLAKTLITWIDGTTEGELILAWANLGALVEGQLKLFLCVHYCEYQNEVDGIRRRGEKIDPDVSMLEGIRQFFVKHIWGVHTNWNPYVKMIQQRRNAIHAFQYKDIGTFQDWIEALRLHLSFVRFTGGGLPYPEYEFSGLREE